jgi:hypothetical protein
MKLLNVPPPKKMAFRAKAVHRLARQKRWPAYVFAAVAQEFPHDVHDDAVMSAAIRVVHIGLIYLSFTLID